MFICQLAQGPMSTQNSDSSEDGPVCSPCLHRPPLTVPMKLGWVHAKAARQLPRLIRNIRRSGATVRESSVVGKHWHLRATQALAKIPTIT